MFPVAADEAQMVTKSFDAVMPTRPDYANRISYVIAPDGNIVYHYMSLNPTKHVEKTLDALRSWAESQRKQYARPESRMSGAHAPRWRQLAVMQARGCARRRSRALNDPFASGARGSSAFEPVVERDRAGAEGRNRTRISTPHR